MAANILQDIARLSDTQNDGEIEIVVADNHIYFAASSCLVSHVS